MITITDYQNETEPYWEVEDSGGKLEKVNIHYDPEYLTGFDRVRVLQQIVEIYSILSGCTEKKWQTVGKVFILFEK